MLNLLISTDNTLCLLSFQLLISKLEKKNLSAAEKELIMKVRDSLLKDGFSWSPFITFNLYLFITFVWRTCKVNIYIWFFFCLFFFCFVFFKQTIKSLSSNIETLKKEVELTAMAAKSKESPSQARQIVSRHSELVLSRTLFCSNSQVQQNLSHKHTVL